MKAFLLELLQKLFTAFLTFRQKQKTEVTTHVDRTKINWNDLKDIRNRSNTSNK